MLTLEEMKHRKQILGLSCEEISKRSGVPFGTVQKVFSGITQTPRHNTLVALSTAFSAPDVTPVPPASGSSIKPDSDHSSPSTSITYSSGTASGTDMVRDVGAVYTTNGSSALAGEDSNSRYSTIRHGDSVPEDGRCSDDPVLTNVHYYDRQGTYTLEDYLALPDDRRVELIDGVIYDMSVPYAGHQVISGQLSHLFNSFIDEHDGSCEVYAAPTDVQLDCDDKTILEPDVFIVCNPSKVTLQRIYGAPDLAIEILSKSTRRKDMTLKLWKYSNAGVREYWIVDPKNQCVKVYDFAHDPDLQDAKTYSFHDKIPVGIYDGKLVIDFERIWKKIARFYPVQTTKN